MIAYVIMKGEYSDRHIVAITLDKEKAEKLKKYHSDIHDDAYVEGYEIDETPESAFENQQTVYSVTIEKGGKSLVLAATTHFGETPYEPRFYFSNDRAMTFTAYLTAKDEEHALKVAQDKRAKMLAEMFGL